MAEEEQKSGVQAPADEEPKLKLNIKSTKQKDAVEVACDCTVRQVRQEDPGRAQSLISFSRPPVA